MCLVFDEAAIDIKRQDSVLEEGQWWDRRLRHWQSHDGGSTWTAIVVNDRMGLLTLMRRKQITATETV